jgi:hypothetical protein
MDNTYWNNNGKYQRLYVILSKKIPREYAVKNAAQNPALETLRKATNCYYDLYNNGLCNRAAEFKTIFGFSGKRNADYDRTEQRMDEIIANAAIEQKVV